MTNKKKSKKTPKKQTAASKKKVLDEMEQVHGKEEEYEATTLDQIWGDTGMDKYGTFKEEEYKSYIDELNKTDLQQHAIKLGLVPVRDRGRLTKNLIIAFKQHISQYKKPVDNKDQALNVSDEVAKILSEGR